jgi:micrococcal nuclease
VVDGDTILLDGDERVRLIGVDTPELHRPNTPVQFYAREASAFTRRLVEHRRVRLEFDRTHPSDGYPRRDKYGRTLAYVYLGDGTFVNLEIVRRGYGFAYTRFPFRYLDEFRAAERAARESGAGLWAEPDSIGRPA